MTSNLSDAHAQVVHAQVATPAHVAGAALLSSKSLHPPVLVERVQITRLDSMTDRSADHVGRTERPIMKEVVSMGDGRRGDRMDHAGPLPKWFTAASLSQQHEWQHHQQNQHPAGPSTRDGPSTKDGASTKDGHLTRDEASLTTAARVRAKVRASTQDGLYL